MARIVESKLVIKGDASSGEKAIKTMTQAIEDMASAAAETQSRLQQMINSMAGGGGGGGGAVAGRGGGRATVSQSTRSPYAPMTSAQLPPAPPGYKWGPGAGVGGGGVGAAPGRGGTAGALARGMSYMQMGAGIYQAAATGQMTPMIGGMMGQIGGQISGIAGGIGAVAGIPLSLLGMGLQIQHAAGQRAIQHYQQQAGNVAIMGDAARGAMRTAAVQGSFTPDEALQTQRRLYDAGAQGAFGQISRLRFMNGVFAPELATQFMTTAARTGAAGRGVGTEASWRKMAIIMGAAFAKESKLPSMSRAMENMSGLMEGTARQTGSLTTERMGTLAGMMGVMEKSGAPSLIGGRGAAAVAGVMEQMGAEEAPAAEMMKWKAFKEKYPDGTWEDFMYWKGTPEAMTSTMGQYKKLFGGMGKGGIGAIAYKGQYGQFGGYGATKEAMDTLDEKAIAKEQSEYEKRKRKGLPEGVVAPGDEYARMTKLLNLQATEQLDFSKKWAEQAVKIETAFNKMADASTSILKLDAASNSAATAIDNFAQKFNEAATKGGGTMVKDELKNMAKDFLKEFLRYPFGGSEKAQ